MGPRGPRAQATRAGRETRNGTLNAKPSSRGGIQKRRGGPTKIDGDGDLDMDSAAARGARAAAAGRGATRQRASRSAGTTSTRGGASRAQTVLRHLNGDTSSIASRGARSTRSRPQNGAGLAYLRVRGLKASKAASNPDGGLKDLLAFLERKASSFATAQRKRNVVIKKSHIVGEYVYIGATKEDGEELIKIDTFTFAGTPLEIVESTDDFGPGSKATESEDTRDVRALLQTILSSRYNGASKLLKLDALATDATLVEVGLFANQDRALKAFEGLMVICNSQFKTAKEKEDAIESISLANNNIDDVAQVETVATTFPRLQNLDMSGNRISNMQGLKRWRGKFRELVTILVTGNPIEATEPNFHASLLEWFPKLQNINGAQVRTAEQIALQVEASRPKPIPQSGPDFRDVGGVGEQFLLEFFTGFDTNREALLTKYYDEDSQFSLSVDNRSRRDPSGPTPLPWAPYLKYSRNLTKITTANARIQRMYKGIQHISDMWNAYPMTRHPNITEHISKYIMDCHPLSGLVDPNGQNQSGVDGLVVCVHGEYDEHDPTARTMGKRSFSRTFILGPGKAGHGPIRIVSDILSLRNHIPLPNVFGSQNQVPPVQNQDQHQAMIVELCRRTGMVPQYSEMCLIETSWDFDRALVVFNDKKAQLPPVAFAAMPQ